MGAQPKRRRTSSVRRQRRSHDKAAFGQIVLCSHCRRPHLSHHVCANCGYYNGREVLTFEETRPSQ